MADDSLSNQAAAVEDFRRARRRAAMQALAARLTGRSIDLGSYNEALRRLPATSAGARTLREIPLDRIVGSVGRYREFTNTFLPRLDTHQQRWASVKTAMTGLKGVPPIEVYQIGDDYFVQDGNHRVSVARDMDLESIEAWVTRIRTPPGPDDDRDEVIVARELDAFLACTELRDSRPEARLAVTAPGKYPLLVEHINVHRHYMGLEWQREIPYPEAAAHWYDHVYRPVADVIDAQGIIRDFPGRTVTDLYLWIARHRSELETHLGWTIDTEAAALDLKAHFADNAPAPPKREQRDREVTQSRVAERSRSAPDPKRQFRTVLVALSGSDAGWRALDQALAIADREQAAIAGLHVVEPGGPDAEALRARFDKRCAQAGIAGRLATEPGKPVDAICARSILTDLVVIGLSRPAGTRVPARINPAHAALLRRCPRPVLAVPVAARPPATALVAYDGNAKSREALYLGAYASLSWGTHLTVVTVSSARRDRAAKLDEAREHLAGYGIDAAYVSGTGSPHDEILEHAAERDVDIVLMGGYRRGPALQVVLGTTVNPVLRAARQPVLVCT